MCDPILVTLLKMQPHSSQSRRENATPSSGTSPLASYKGVPPPGKRQKQLIKRIKNKKNGSPLMRRVGSGRFEGVRGYLSNKGERWLDFIEIIGPAVKRIKLDVKRNLFICQVFPFPSGRWRGVEASWLNKIPLSLFPIK